MKLEINGLTKTYKHGSKKAHGNFTLTLKKCNILSCK